MGNEEFRWRLDDLILILLCEVGWNIWGGGGGVGVGLC